MSFNENDTRVNKNCKYNASNKRENSQTERGDFLAHPVEFKFLSARLIARDLTLPYLTYGVGWLLHLPSAEAVSVRPNAQPRYNQRSQ